MLKAIGIRALQAIPTLIGVSLIVFIIVRMTGDPAAILLPPETSPEVVAQFRAKYGLDQPLVVQYFSFIAHALVGDFGNSIRYTQPVSTLIAARLPATIQLALFAVIFATVIGLILGVAGGLKPNSFVDVLGRVIALFSQAIPTFFLGIILILIFGVALRLLPTGGMGSFQNLILPGVTLGAFMLPLVLRTARGSVLDVAHQDYVRTARSKGMPESRVIGVHIVKSSMIPVVTVIGLQVGMALGGAVVTETVFSWPGIGQLLVNAISTRDFPVVQGVVLFAAVVFVAVNLIVDIIYSLLDPRIRLS